jgi:uncharacterized membrane protein
MLNLDSANELDNDIVTVTKIQIALKATARSLQSNLSQLVMASDLQSELGLWQLLQSSWENLLNNSPDWTHFIGSSQTLNDRENAQNLFETYSLAARQKFSAETLSNIQGNITQPEFMIDESETFAADYIVVTLLIGTAHDRPLFASIKSAAELKAALQTVAAMPPEYLLIFELLWSPQLPTDSLSASQFAQDYSDLIPI